jgi:hypothetical protein
VRASQAAFASATTSELRSGGPLQRSYRDMQAAVAHFMTGEQSMLEIGGVLARSPGAALAF